MSAVKPAASATKLFLLAGCLGGLALLLLAAGGLLIFWSGRIEPDPREVDISVAQQRETSARPQDPALPVAAPASSPVEEMAPDPGPSVEASPGPDAMTPRVEATEPSPTPRPQSSREPTPTPVRQTAQSEPEEDNPTLEGSPAPRRGFRGRIQNIRERRKHFPVDGVYVCYSGSASSPVERFELDEDTYEDLREEEDGEFTFDLSDNSMTFTEGPFQGRYLGVSVRSGQELKPSNRFRFTGDYGVAEADTIHLVSPGGRYSQRSGLGLRCALEE